MSAATLVKELNEAFKFAPVTGHANEYVIHAKTPGRNASAGMEMTPGDWDKFEKDIADAFEQVP